jgi:hypothetical protein
VERLHRPGHADVGDAPLLGVAQRAQHLPPSGNVDLADGGKAIGVEPQRIRDQFGEAERVVESSEGVGEVAVIGGRQEHDRPLQPFGTVNRDEGDGVGIGDPGGVELLGGLFSHRIEVVEEGPE